MVSSLSEILSQLPVAQKKEYGKLCAKARKEGTNRGIISKEFSEWMQPHLEALAPSLKIGSLVGQFWQQFQKTEKIEKKPEVELSEVAKKIPYPLGLKVREFAIEKERYLSKDAFSNYPYLIASLNSLFLRYLSILCICEYSYHLGAFHPELNSALKEKLQTPSDGIWKQIIDLSLSRCAKTPKAFWLPAIQDFFQKKIKVEGEKKTKAIQILFQELIEFRNKLLHEPLLFSLYGQEVQEASNKMSAICSHLDFFYLQQLQSKGKEHWISYESAYPQKREEAKEEKENTVFLFTNNAPKLSLHPFVVPFERETDSLLDLYFLNGWKQSEKYLSFVSFGNPESLNHFDLSLPYSDFQSYLRLLHLSELPPARLYFYRTTRLHTIDFIGRKREIDSIVNSINTSESPYCLLFSEAAYGKTALLSWLHDESSKKNWNPHIHWIWHFCDSADNRNHAIVFLRSLVAQLQEITQKEEPTSDQLTELQIQFLKTLQECSLLLQPHEKVIIVLDGLNESMEETATLLPIIHALPNPTDIPKSIHFLVSYRTDENHHSIQVDQKFQPWKEGVHFVPLCSPLKGLHREEIVSFLEKEHQQEPLSEQTYQAIWKSMVPAKEETKGVHPGNFRFFINGIRNHSFHLHHPETFPHDQTELFERFWNQLPFEDMFFLQRFLGILSFLPELADDDLFSRMFSHFGKPEGLVFTREDVAEKRSLVNKQLLFSGQQYRLVHSSFRDFVRSRFRPQEQGELLFLLLRADHPEKLRQFALQGQAEKILEMAPWDPQTYRRFQFLTMGAVWMAQAQKDPRLLLEALSKSSRIPLHSTARNLMYRLLSLAHAPPYLYKKLSEENG